MKRKALCRLVASDGTAIVIDPHTDRVWLSYDFPEGLDAEAWLSEQEPAFRLESNRVELTSGELPETSSVICVFRPSPLVGSAISRLHRSEPARRRGSALEDGP